MTSNHGKPGARMVVRRYVMDLIYRNGGNSVRVPSYNVLSKELEMARSTAQLELKSLVNEGFLITRPGIGTFTNPTVWFGHCGRRRNPLIAMISGDGKRVHHRYYDWTLQSHLGMAVTRRPATLMEVTLYSENEEALFEELRSIQCDAILWMFPPAELHPLVRKTAALRPLLTVDGFVEGVSGVNFDRYRKGFPVAEFLLRENRTRLLFAQTEHYRATTYRAFREAYAAAGVPLDDRFLLFGENCLEEMKRTLKDGFRPQAVMFCHEFSEALPEILAGAGIDLERECRLVSPMYKPRNLKAPMLCPEFPFAGYADAAAEELFRRLGDPEAPAEHRMVYCDFPVSLV